MLLKILDKFKPIKADRAVRRLAGVSLFLNLAAWVMVAARLFPSIKSNRLIALHYNVYLNVNNVGPAVFAFAAPALGTIIIAANFWLAARSYRPSRANTLVILGVTVFYELLVLLSAFFLILVNISR